MSGSSYRVRAPERRRRPAELVTREALSPYIGPYILAEAEYAELIG